MEQEHLLWPVWLLLLGIFCCERKPPGSSEHAHKVARRDATTSADGKQQGPKYIPLFVDGLNTGIHEQTKMRGATDLLQELSVNRNFMILRDLWRIYSVRKYGLGS